MARRMTFLSRRELPLATAQYRFPRRWAPLFLLLLAGGLLGCGTTHLARPMNAGALRVDSSLGGPMVVFGGAPIPVPLTVVSVAYGLHPQWHVHGAIHPTALAFGNVGATAGAAYHPTRDASSFTTLGLDLSGFVRGNDGLGILDPYAAYGFALPHGFGVAPGVHATVTVGPKTVFAPAPFVMAWKTFGATTVETELRWSAPWENSEILVPAWLAPGGRGAISLLFGVAWDSPGDSP